MGRQDFQTDGVLACKGKKMQLDLKVLINNAIVLKGAMGLC